MDHLSTEKDDADLVTMTSPKSTGGSSQHASRQGRLKMQKIERNIYLSPYVASIDFKDSSQFTNLRRKVFGVNQLIGLGGDHTAAAICDWKEFEESCISPKSTN